LEFKAPDASDFFSTGTFPIARIPTAVLSDNDTSHVPTCQTVYDYLNTDNDFIDVSEIANEALFEALLFEIVTPGEAGSGNATMPAVTDNHLVKGDGATGLQETGIVVDDDDNVSGINKLTVTKLEVDASSPMVTLKDSDAPYSANQEMVKYGGQYVDGGNSTENADIILQTKQGGSFVTKLQYDESAEAWEIPSGNNLVLEGGYIVGAAKIGSEISANATLATTQLQSTVYKASAACTVTLDAAADVGYGYIVGFKVKDASETLILRPEGGEIINLHGTALAAGTGIQSPGNAGDFIFLMAVTDANATTDGYETWGYGEEAWTSE
jgi:hypothetical protein